jgi:hypothetical protein
MRFPLLYSYASLLILFLLVFKGPMPQTTIVAALNGSIQLCRLPRSGPHIDPARQLSSSTLNSRVGPRAPLPSGVLGRRWEGGTAEASVLALFVERQRQVAEGIEADESELDENRDRVPLKRHSYTQEHKLAAIDYALHTWRINAQGVEERIS